MRLEIGVNSVRDVLTKIITRRVSAGYVAGGYPALTRRVGIIQTQKRLGDYPSCISATGTMYLAPESTNNETHFWGSYFSILNLGKKSL